MCFSAIPHTPHRHKKRIRGGKNEWGNTNVDNSIYIVRAKCELSHFEECRSWRLFAENVHNSIETWPRLRQLPLSRHPSRGYFMCHHLPAKESRAKVMSVSCPSGSPLTILPLPICGLIKKKLSSVWTLFLSLCQMRYWQNIQFGTIWASVDFHDKCDDG